MRFQHMFVVLAMLGLAACGSTKGEYSGATTGAGGTDQAAAAPYGTGAADAGAAAQVKPGSQEDLDMQAGARVFFGLDRADLSTTAREVLNKQGEWLKTYNTVAVTVEGHTDERGTREYNLALGERRASAVKNYLVSLGVDPSRVETTSYGKERPAVDGSDESAWSQNRRAVTVVK